MTANQIAYSKVREDTRHNVVSERQKDRDLAIGERTAAANELQAATAARRQSEDARHNLESERQNWFNITATTQENRRHNQEQERINWFSAQSEDTGRQRQAAVSERQATVAERQATVAERGASVNERNAATNEANAVSNRIQAEASRTSASAALRTSEANLMNAQTNQNSLAESMRHNLIAEGETKRHNTALESEQMRSNRMGEYLKSRDQSIQRTTNAIRQQQADVAEYEAQTHRGAAYAKGFRDVSTGVSTLGNLALSIYNTTKRKGASK